MVKYTPERGHNPKSVRNLNDRFEIKTRASAIFSHVLFQMGFQMSFQMNDNAMIITRKCDSVQNLCVSSKVLIFVVEYKSNKNNGAYDATNIGIIFHISLLWRSF